MKDKRLTIYNYNDDEVVKSEIRRAKLDTELWETFLEMDSDMRKMIVATIIGLAEMQKREEGKK